MKKINKMAYLALPLIFTACAASEPVMNPPNAAVVLDPTTAAFLAGLEGATPIFQLTPDEARNVLLGAQSGAVAKPEVVIEDRTLPVGPTGQTRIRVLRPNDVGADEQLPGIVYFHGAGWVMGDPETHDRLVRELTVGARAVTVFVDYERSPESRYPVAIQQDYAVTEYVADNPDEFGIDASKIAIAGDSVGGNMTAVVSMMAKRSNGPRLVGQLLFYPVTDADMDSDSYRALANGPWLTKEAMVWFWDQYLPDVSARQSIDVSPLNASVEELQGLPRALVITAENDVLRDEGEAYARKLEQAGVEVTSIRYNNTIHDFVLLNALSQNPATRAAIEQSVRFLRSVFE